MEMPSQPFRPLEERVDTRDSLQDGEVLRDEAHINSLLFDEIALTHPMFYQDTLTPTPLDGEHLSFAGETYSDVALHYMQMRFLERVDAIGASLTGQESSMIMESIVMEHFERMRQNTDGLERLQLAYLDNTESITLEDAQRIERARKSTASQLDFIKLISSRAELEAIEVAKFTKPLDHDAIAGATTELFERIGAVSQEDADFEMRIMSFEEQATNCRYVDMGPLNKQGIVSIKKTIAEATYHGVELVLKMRESMILLPAERHIGSTPPHYVEINGKTANIQKLGFTAYWTLRDIDAL